MNTTSAASNHQKKPENIIWIEEVLLNNIEEGTLVPDESPQHTSDTASIKSLNSNSNNENENPSTPASKTDDSHQSLSSSSQDLKVGIAEIELKDENFLGDERIHSLSRIVTGKIKYFLENKDSDDERYTYWLIKLPNLVDPQRQLSQTIDASRREIGFYTEILPSIKEWLMSHPPSKQIEFQVPICFYGKFNRPIDPEPDLNIITHILDSESLLVLEDLRASGYGKRHFGSGLLLSEAMAAIDEIVKFHAVTWAMQEIDKRKLGWTHLYDGQKMSHLYFSLVESCYPTLQAFLTKSRHPQAALISVKVARLRPHLLKKISTLLTQPGYPLPNTLCHMDLWSENILFRMKAQDKEDEVAMEEAELDCCIVDWQLVSYGSPTHDLALLLMLSMEPAYRRENTALLLKYYYEAFRTTASYLNLEVPFDFHMLRNEFKQSCVLATLMGMGSIDVVLMEETTEYRLLEALMDLIDEKLI